MTCTLLLNKPLVINFCVICNFKAMREFLEIRKSILPVRKPLFTLVTFVQIDVIGKWKFPSATRSRNSWSSFRPMRDIIWVAAGSAARRSWRTRRLLNSILGLLYLLTISSICYQQRQKNRTRRPTAGEIKGKLGWNFYITLDGGCVGRTASVAATAAATQPALFDFPSPAPWSTDLTLAVSTSSIIEFHPGSISNNLLPTWVEFRTLFVSRKLQKMNAGMRIWWCEEDLTGGTRNLVICCKLLTPML